MNMVFQGEKYIYMSFLILLIKLYDFDKKRYCTTQTFHFEMTKQWFLLDKPKAKEWDNPLTTYIRL